MLSRADLDFLQDREDAAATRGFFGGMLVGALLGIVLTLVFAPRRGDETRSLLAAAAGEVKHQAAELARHASSISDPKVSQNGSGQTGKAATTK